MAEPITAAPAAPPTESTGGSPPPPSDPIDKPASTGTPTDKPAPPTEAGKPAASKPTSGGAPAKAGKAAGEPGKEPGKGKGAPAAAAAAGEEAEIPDGREFEVEGERVTFEDLKESHRFIQEAAKVKQQAEQLATHVRATLNTLIERPQNGGPAKLSVDGLRNFLALANGGNRELAENLLVEASSQVISDRLRWEEMPEEFREGERAKRELEEHRRALRSYKEREAREKHARGVKEAQTLLQEKFTEALKGVGLKETKGTLADLADVLLKAHESGITMTPERAARELKKTYERRRTEYLKETDPKDYPPEVVEALRKRDLETVKDKLSAPPAKPGDEEELKPETRRRRRVAGIF